MYVLKIKQLLGCFKDALVFQDGIFYDLDLLDLANSFPFLSQKQVTL